MAGFQRRNFGANKSGAAPASAQLWSINVKLAKYDDKGNLRVKLSGVKKEDVNKLSNIAPDIFKIKQTNINNNWETYMMILGDKIQEFSNLRPTIEQCLKDSKNYTDDSINGFVGKIEKYIKLVPTNAEVEANNNIIANNWKELLVKLEDPEVRKKFLMFQTTYVCAKHYKDAMLSKKNVVSVLSQDPMATFVTDEDTWARRFNRRVIHGSPYVIISKVENIIPPIHLLNADPIVQSYGGWNAIVSASGGMWYGEAYAAIKRVRKERNLVKPDMYYKSKAYDVRYTTPIDPTNDKFMEIAGLVNNITGEINDMAKEKLKQSNPNGEEDFNAKREGGLSDNNLNAFKTHILNLCSRVGVKVIDIGSPSDVIANGVYSYAYKQAESLNMLHDKTKTLFASAMVYAIAASFDIQSDKVKQSIDKIKSRTKEELSDIVMNIYELYRKIADFNLVESLIRESHILSFDELENLLFSAAMSNDDITNSFNEMLNRINNLYKD